MPRDAARRREYGDEAIPVRSPGGACGLGGHGEEGMRPHREGDVPVPGVVADSVLAEAMAERLDQGRTTNRDIVLSPTLVSVRNDRYATVLTGPPAADWAALRAR